MHYFLRAEVRVREGRNVEPSAASADPQSVKTAGPAIESGYDGGKNVSGRKRRILVDPLGLLLTVFVHDAHRDHIAGFHGTSETMIYVAMINLMLRRLTNNQSAIAFK